MRKVVGYAKRHLALLVDELGSRSREVVTPPPTTG
ncbi:DUF3140 domain-containing protein [Mycobacterium timonense]|jgi:hypothetical protein|nr:DUF3140 domain-containing protein [Mycobacterium timonense]